MNDDVNFVVEISLRADKKLDNFCIQFVFYYFFSIVWWFKDFWANISALEVTSFAFLLMFQGILQLRQFHKLQKKSSKLFELQEKFFLRVFFWHS